MLFCQGCEAPMEISVPDPDLESALAEFKQVFGVDHSADFTDFLGMTEDDFGPNQVRNVHKALAKLIETTSDSCLRDFPLCPECAGKTIQAERKTVILMQSEYDMYVNTLQSFVDDKLQIKSPSPEEQNDVEEQKLKLEMMREHKNQVLLEIDRFDDQRNMLDELQEYYWDQIRRLDVYVKLYHTESNMLTRMIDLCKDEYLELKRTNVYDDSFHIYYDGHFGTINESRLGKLKSIPVDNSEINHALGQFVHLLQCMAIALPNFEFSRYDLYSKGNFSRIARRGETPFDLFNPEASFLSRGFNTGMSYLLSCMKELGDYAEQREGKKVFRYDITGGDEVGGFSVKVKVSGPDEKWTKALKNMLVNLKCLVCWAAKYDN
eukprot:TRINITY_DN16738_c0_g1_i3.p1 TRINITY_DN16738_c0_g1~~TRINITY_DN16738_c0_g1_i3.p1  ORF type:complete len:378 (+),score=86.66 TRINITY_DN16738_c0_g1_i3:78-1211(+)